MYPAHCSASPLLRRSALWAALSLALASAGAQALTLASPQVQSKLGEPLRAEIGITQISAEEEQGLQAELADADLYRSLHMELPTTTGGRVLDVHVQLIKRESGNLVLRLSSQQAVTRRDMDLLVRMRWSTGQLLRNVTLSMDDGAAGRSLVSPIAPSPATTSSAPTASPAPVPATKPRAPVEAKPAQTQSAENKGKGQSKGSSKLEVQRGDTASEIVVKQMPGGVSLDQMLLALLRHNPDAFVDNNVNRLKAGALLTLPTAEEAKELSREDAHEEVLFQTQNFNAYRAELAARAGRGEIAKAERSSAGKLQAQVQNKANKATPDKLTLSKPKDAKAEEQIAQQRQAKEVAERAAELSRNVNELGKLANEAAGAAGEGVNLPNPPQTAQNDWIEELTQNPLAPVGAGVLVALMVVLTLLRRHQRNNEDDDIQGLPPLNVKFDLDLPDHSANGQSSDTAHSHGAEDGHHASAESASDDAPQTARPTFEIPDISLDLSPSSHHPLQVRMDLAEELWKLGQLHTSRALMEEVAQEASGELQAKALQWLAERS